MLKAKYDYDTFVRAQTNTNDCDSIPLEELSELISVYPCACNKLSFSACLCFCFPSPGGDDLKYPGQAWTSLDQWFYANY